MQVKYLRLWRGNREGSVKEIADGAANLLVRRGVCEPVEVVRLGKTSGRKRRNSKRVSVGDSSDG